MAAFVVLEHDHPELHWDLMLENAGVLKTWRLPSFPPLAGQKLLVQALADHRLHYLTYEGPVSGNRGRVVRRDQGQYELLARPASDDVLPFQTDRLCLSLEGKVLCGIIVMERLAGDDWQLWWTP